MATRGMIEAGKAFITLFINDETARGLDMAGRKMSRWGRNITRLGMQVGAVAAGISGPLLASFRSFAQVGDMLDKMAIRTGVGVNMLARLQFTAEQAGTDVQTLERGLGGVGRFLLRLERQVPSSIWALRRLGLTMQELMGLSPDQRLERIMTALGRISDMGVSGGLAQEILGRAGRQMIPMIAQWQETQEIARQFGLVPDNLSDITTKAAEVTDAMNLMWRTFQMIGVQIGYALAEPMLELLDRMARLFAGVSTWVAENKALVTSLVAVGAALTAASVALVGLGGALQVVGLTVRNISGVFGFFLTSKLGLFITLVTGATAAWITFTKQGAQFAERFMERLAGLQVFFTDVFLAITKALEASQFQLALDIMTASLRVFRFEVLGDFTKMFQDIKIAWARFFSELLATAKLHTGQLGVMLQEALAPYERWLARNKFKATALWEMMGLAVPFGPTGWITGTREARQELWKRLTAEGEALENELLNNRVDLANSGYARLEELGRNHAAAMLKIAQDANQAIAEGDTERLENARKALEELQELMKRAQNLPAAERGKSLAERLGLLPGFGEFEDVARQARGQAAFTWDPSLASRQFAAPQAIKTQKEILKVNQRQSARLDEIKRIMDNLRGGLLIA